MNITKHTILPLLAAMLTLFIACSDEEVVSVPGTETGDGLRITLALSGKQPLYAKADKQTRATIEGENSLNENTVSTVHFFLFNPTTTDGNVSWTFKKSWSFTVESQTAGANDGNDETATPDYYPTNYFTLQTGQAWRTTLEITLRTADTKGSRLYVIANLPEGTDVSGIDTWDKFCEWAVTDTLIQRKYSNSTTLENSSAEAYKAQLQAGKRFLMDGYYEFTEAADNANNSGTNHQVTVDLRRAAAKVRVNIYKATSWKYNDEVVSIDMEKIEAKLSNYATTTKVVTPESGEGLGDNGHVSTYAPLEAYDRDLANPSGKEYLRSVLFYTFAHDWSGDVGHETTFIMNLPYTSGRDNNWYKIVFVPDGGQRYERNTFYEVDVTVAYDGSVDSYEPSPISNPEYKVSEWYPEEFDVENTTPVDYLILDKYFIDMRNVADEQITFYSSNKVTVEVVHDVADEIEALKAAGEKFPWPEGFKSEEEYIGKPVDETVLGGATVADIPGIYYPDKENRRVPIYYAGTDYDDNTNNSSMPTYNTKGNTFTDLNKAKYLPVTVVTKENAASYASKEESEVYITWPGNKFAESGEKIDVYSAIPRNVTLRFITLKVTMDKLYGEGTITRYVIIKQYPLEYIVNQFGYYSFMDDNILSRDDVENTYTYASTFDNNDASGVGVDNASGLYKVYCGDLAWKNKWVTIPKEITEGLLVSAAGNYIKFDGTSSDYALSGHIGRGVAMKCKFYLDGTADTYSNYSTTARNQHYWTDAEGGHYGIIYQVDDSYGDTDEKEGTTGLIGNFPKLTDEYGEEYNYKVVGGLRRYNSRTENSTTTPEKIDGNDADISNLVGLDANTPSNNNRMYEVRITATSSKYRIGYPKTDTWTPTTGKAQLYADDSWDNSQLVSPHFVIASQLGNTSATAFWEMAHDHCMHYVEVDNKGNVFDNWRLPTIAELSIIKQYQLDDDVFDVTMNRILNSDGETQPRYWTSARHWYVNTTGEGGAEEQEMMSSETMTVVAGYYAGKSAPVPTYTEDSKGKRTYTNTVRVRCVRDIKGEDKNRDETE